MDVAVKYRALELEIDTLREEMCTYLTTDFPAAPPEGWLLEESASLLEELLRCIWPDIGVEIGLCHCDSCLDLDNSTDMGHQCMVEVVCSARQEGELLTLFKTMKKKRYYTWPIIVEQICDQSTITLQHDDAEPFLSEV